MAAYICGTFIVFMDVAMVFYPGGTPHDTASVGYSFFNIFFSDLGMTVTPSGQSNHVSLVFFTVALAAVGIALALFFIGFGTKLVSSRFNAWIRALAALCGIVAGISFIGVAFTPWDLYLQARNEFVVWSFRAFLGATALYAVAIFRDSRLPRRFGWVLVAFAALQTAYILLLAFGPSVLLPAGRMIHVAGQKTIAFASVVAVLIQAVGAYRLARRS